MAEQCTGLNLDRTDLAVKRTLMAATRSLLAWVRTGISLISFGFSIYKVLETFQEDGILSSRRSFLTPDKIGAVLCILGVLGIAFGIYEYRKTYHECGSKLEKPPVVMAGLITFLGLALLLAIFFHL